MAKRHFSVTRNLILGVLLLLGLALVTSGRASAEELTTQSLYGIAAKRPVLQAACQYCPWGALGDVVKKAMSFHGYDVAICYACSGENGARIVSQRLMPPEVSDRQFAEGTGLQPQAR
ncbi:MAG: hypothetical protein WA268_14655 [Xanthobacteraceae bacterium]